MVNIFGLFFRKRHSIISCNSYGTLSKVEYSLSAPHTYIHINYWIFNRYSLILSNVQTNWIYKGKMESYELFILNIHSLNFDESMGGIQFIMWSWNFWNTIKPMDVVLCSVFSFFFHSFVRLKHCFVVVVVDVDFVNIKQFVVHFGTLLLFFSFGK